MKLEFPGVFAELFQEVKLRLKQELYLKLEQIKNGEKVLLAEGKLSGYEKLAHVVNQHFMGGLQKEMKNDLIRTPREATTPFDDGDSSSFSRANEKARNTSRRPSLGNQSSYEKKDLQ